MPILGGREYDNDNLSEEEHTKRVKYIMLLLARVGDSCYPGVNQLMYIHTKREKEFKVSSDEANEIIGLAVSNMVKRFNPETFSNYIGNAHVGDIARDIYNIIVITNKNFILIE